MSSNNCDRMGHVPLKSLNAFNLPKLKKFPARLEAKAPSTNTTEGTENVENAGRSSSPVDAASPVVEKKSNQVAVSKPTTTRKSRRQAKSRPSEVTVYYDAVQSPDEAKTVSKQKQRQARATKVAIKQAAAAQEAEPADVSGVADAPHDLPDEQHFDTQPEPMDAEDELPSFQLPEAAQPLAAVPNLSTKPKRHSDSLSEDLATAATAATRRRSKNNDKPSSQDTAHTAAGVVRQVSTEPQQPAAKGSEALRDGQEIFKYMQQLAEDAADLLPQDDEQKKRGRGRPKKDLRLVDALHQSWKGKSYYERLQELTRQEVEEEEQAALAAGPEYRPMTATALAEQETQPSSKPLSGSQPQAAAEPSGNGRKRRTTRPSSRAGTADSESDMDDAVQVTEAAADEPAAKLAAAAAAGGPTKRRAMAGAAAGAGRGNAAAGGKTGKAAAGTAAAAAAAANKGRKSTVFGAANVQSKSPFLTSTAAGTRPLSSRANGSLAWESTPAAPSGVASLSDRPPWSVGGSSAAAAGAAIGAAGQGAATGTAKPDKGAVHRMQTALDAKTEELAALKDQLKESQELVAKLRSDQKAHPKAIAQLEKQKQALEKKVEAVERRQAALERENEGLQEKLAKQEAEKSALQEQLAKSDKELKSLRLKLKQSTAKLEKCQAMGQKMQEMGAALAAESQPVWIE